MNNYDKKYEINSELTKIKEFHSHRRMFAIKNNKIYVGPKNAPYSHAKWFEDLGWISPEKDSLMNTLTRGFVDNSGLYFYTGYKMKWSKKSEKEVLTHLKDLMSILKIKTTKHVFGGIIKSIPGTKWPPEKDLGPIKKLIN